MGEADGLWIHDVGACTPLGFCALSSAAAVWAEISRVAAPGVPIAGEPIAAFEASTGLVDAQTPLPQRLVALSQVALRPLLAALEDLPGCLTLFVMLSEHTPAPQHNEQVAKLLQESLAPWRRGRHQSLSIKTLSAGPGNFAAGLQAAVRYLTAPSAAAVCLVGGVDCSVSPCQRASLRARGALYEPSSGEGIIPSEAAAFITVSRATQPPQRPIVAHLKAWSRGEMPSGQAAAEPGTPAKTTTEQAPAAPAPPVSAAWAPALHASVTGVWPTVTAPRLWISDASGESLRAAALAAIYTAPELGDFADTQIIEPTRLTGYTGAAFAPLACAIAIFGRAYGLADAADVLLSAQDATGATAWTLWAPHKQPPPLACAADWGGGAGRDVR